MTPYLGSEPFRYLRERAIGGFGSAQDKGDGYASQKAALRSFIQTNGSLVPATAANTPVITLGTSSPTLAGSLVARTDAKIRYLGGHTIENVANTQPGTYPNDQFRTPKNLSWSGTERTEIGGIAEFDLTCPKFEVMELGNTNGVRLLVDNQIAGTWTVANDGSIKYRLVDFSAISAAAVQRRIRLEYFAKTLMGGVKLDTTGTMLSLLDLVTYRICWLGDSFVEGSGTTTVGTHAALAAYASKLLGFRDYRMSGFGGTGYNVAFDPGFGTIRPTLADRVGFDGVSADVFVVAMGFNDADADAGLSAKVNTTLDTLRSNNPSALIMVVGPWGNGSGVATKPGVESVVQAACAGRAGVKFESVYAKAFTKADASHPDPAGHIVLGTEVANRVKSWVGA